VTRTLARQSVRSDARRTAREHSAARGESEASTAEIVERGSMHRRLVEAVMALDEPYRSSILYPYLDGMSAPQIAECCGLLPLRFGSASRAASRSSVRASTASSAAIGARGRRC